MSCLVSKKRSIQFLAGLLGLVFSLLASAENAFQNINLETTKVRGNIYMLSGVNGFAGGNIGVSVGDDGTLIVDDQFKPMSDKIKASLRALGGDNLQFVLNTHWHSDHTQGNVVFAEEATIIAHENVRKRHSATQSNDFSITPPAPESSLPVITFSDSLSIHFNGEEIQMFHLPAGHTDGDGVVYFTESNVAHLGDLYFSGLFPFVDLKTGGNVLQLEKNIAHLLVHLPEDVKIIPGHGPLSDMAGLMRYHDMLVKTIAIVKSKVAAGKSLPDIQKEGFDGEWTSYGAGFINAGKWIELIYQSM